MGSQRFRVLIVDDEPDIKESIGMVLESLAPHVEVLFAGDGKEALQVLEDHEGEGDPVELIMSDYKMPNMDGIEFLRQVKEKYPGIPRLMLTAYPDPELAVQAVREAGVGLFIAKPFDPEYVGEVLKAFSLEG